MKRDKFKELYYRRKLAEIMKDRRTPLKTERQADELYRQIGVAGCDYETIERFILYRRWKN